MDTNVQCGDIRVVVLAGGKGTRLRPLTAVFPKPLVPLGDQAVLEILLHRLARSGFRKVTLCTGYLSEMIMVLCGNGDKFGLEIQYAKEERPMGTVGPVSLVDQLTDPFVVTNGDLLTTMDFTKLLSFHRDCRADITIGTYPRDVKIDFGVVESDGKGRFKGFKEKPTFHFEVSMGVNVLNRSVLSHVKPGEFMDMPDLIMKVNDAGGNVCCYREDCFWLDIGRMEDYALAQEAYATNREQFL